MHEIPTSVAITAIICITLIILVALSRIGKKNSDNGSKE